MEGRFGGVGRARDLVLFLGSILARYYGLYVALSLALYLSTWSTAVTETFEVSSS